MGKPTHCNTWVYWLRRVTDTWGCVAATTHQIKIRSYGDTIICILIGRHNDVSLFSLHTRHHSVNVNTLLAPARPPHQLEELVLARAGALPACTLHRYISDIITLNLASRRATYKYRFKNPVKQYKQTQSTSKKNVGSQESEAQIWKRSEFWRKKLSSSSRG